MKTYYSIIKVVPNSLVGDAVGIGLILSDDTSFFVKFSDLKIKIAKSLLGEKKTFLNFFISKIEKSLTNMPTQKLDNEMDLFRFSGKINSQYLSYLNKYSNNIIQYGHPNNFHLISDEPNDVGTKEHRLWEKLQKGKNASLSIVQRQILLLKKLKKQMRACFLPLISLSVFCRNTK